MYLFYLKILLKFVKSVLLVFGSISRSSRIFVFFSLYFEFSDGGL